jgi:hypothetical protein
MCALNCLAQTLSNVLGREKFGFCTNNKEARPSIACGDGENWFA